jgi:hypothetical protein
LRERARDPLADAVRARGLRHDLLERARAARQLDRRERLRNELGRDRRLQQRRTGDHLVQAADEIAHRRELARGEQLETRVGHAHPPSRGALAQDREPRLAPGRRDACDQPRSHARGELGVELVELGRRAIRGQHHRAPVRHQVIERVEQLDLRRPLARQNCTSSRISTFVDRR